MPAVDLKVVAVGCGTGSERPEVSFWQGTTQLLDSYLVSNPQTNGMAFQLIPALFLEVGMPYAISMRVPDSLGVVVNVYSGKVPSG